MKKFIIVLAALFAGAAAFAGHGSGSRTGGDAPRILAHRGGRAEQEENTLSAFKATYKAGCHGFETDIHMTADGELVIMHDSDLGRMTGAAGVIEELPAEYIRSLRTKNGNPVPFLGDLMAFFNSCSDMYVEFELKTNGKYYPEERLEQYCDKVWAAVMAARPADALYVLSSFDARPLRYIKSRHPEAELMLITSRPCDAATVAKCSELGLHRVAARLGGTSRDGVTLAHRKGMAVNLWPGESVQDTELAAGLGADYLCTDIPCAVMRHIRKNRLHIVSNGPVNLYDRELSRTAPALVRGAAKKLVVFDLDGTLTQHKTPLTPEAKAALDRLGSRYSLLMAGGGGADRIHNQMNGYPIDILGNYGMQEGRVTPDGWKIVREESVPVDTAFFDRECTRLREKYGYTRYWGDNYEVHKSGMVTFGLLGTAAPKEEKLNFDVDKKKRRAMFPEVCEVFKDHAVFIGGTTSFDLAEKRFNKYDAVMRYAAEKGIGRDEIVFFGDDIDDGGNDSHIRLGGMDYIRVWDYTDFPLLSELLLKQ